PFSVVFKNGLSPFGYKDGRLYADEFQKLYSSDAGLEFGGSIIDNNPPDGWRFCHLLSKWSGDVWSTE
ncbi:hypothetical protein KPNIH14_28233, partial [Klebsiella pneumoniae subsp. pneumoniae KPNIH14]